MIKFGTATLAGAFVALAFAPVGASAQASHHPHRYPHHRYHGDTVGTIGNDGSAYGYNRVSGRPFYKCEIDLGYGRTEPCDGGHR